jgi:hypothetical protein
MRPRDARKMSIETSILLGTGATIISTAVWLFWRTARR